jgi:protein YIPF5/7
MFLEFQNFESSPGSNYDYTSAPEYYSPNPTQHYQPNIFTPNFDQPYRDEETELPLLEELEIYPTRIIEKSLAVINPFHKKGLAEDPEYLFRDTDLAG